MQNETHDTVHTGGEEVVRGEEISWKRLPPVALLVAFGAAVANAIVYSAASGLGLIPQDILVPGPGGEQPLTAALVVIGSVVGAIGGAGVFGLIGMFARRPVRTFCIVATVVLVLSLATPLTIPGAPLSMVLSLEAMHVAAWAVTVGLLTTLARRTEPVDL
jgi:Family of unknown function (DUF6069)